VADFYFYGLATDLAITFVLIQNLLLSDWSFSYDADEVLSHPRQQQMFFVDWLQIFRFARYCSTVITG
jgi:hypothetical protein